MAAVERPRGRPPTGWRSYDSVAEVYERVAVPRFAPLARDLIEAASPASDATVLDIGTGTGLAARAVAARLASPGLVVGIDPSISMLLGGGSSPGVARVAGVVPGLPFPDEVFDVAVANLVLSHLPGYGAALVDAVRVLRRQGRFGCTAWGPAEPAHGDSQTAQADDLVDSLMLARGLDLTPPHSAVPWEERFRERENLETALRDAGLAHIDIRSHAYRWTQSLDEYLAGRAWPFRGRYILERAGEELWDEIQLRAASELRHRFGEAIHSEGSVWIAVATRP